MARSASYDSDWRAGAKPSAAPIPCSTKPSFRLAVTFGSFCRRDPAAAFRGLANGALPSATRCSFSAAKSSTAKKTSPLTSNSAGTSSPARRSGITAMVRTFAVTSSPTRPSPRVAAVTQPTLLVHQIQGEAVDLELAQEAGLLDPRLAQLADRPRRPAVQLLVAEGIVQAHHLDQVLNRSERGRDRPADLLGRRVGCAQCWESVLQRLEVAHRGVEVGVGQRRRVEHVVAPASVLDPLAQLRVPLASRRVRLGLREPVSRRAGRCHQPRPHLNAAHRQSHRLVLGLPPDAGRLLHPAGAAGAASCWLAGRPPWARGTPARTQRERSRRQSPWRRRRRRRPR